ncbi:hypothetical protein GCM10009557_11560 [Virgisporangium ochraceum]|uniref:Uncharacterized protein n=1 Tax=Virgisporangium ochraceum TaxID=65505 RepID=A0A8J4EBY7_9ACTN|nr:hypothetical protein Voc01_048120 [Virgisporangium ochraceum]
MTSQAECEAIVRAALPTPGRPVVWWLPGVLEAAMRHVEAGRGFRVTRYRYDWTEGRPFITVMEIKSNENHPENATPNRAPTPQVRRKRRRK